MRGVEACANGSRQFADARGTRRSSRRACATLCYMGTVGVRELRQNLSVYLDRVKRGEALTVTEHGRVVAMLRPPETTGSPTERLVAEGRARPATRSLRDLPKPLRVTLPRPLSAILDEQRDDRL